MSNLRPNGQDEKIFTNQSVPDEVFEAANDYVKTVTQVFDQMPKLIQRTATSFFESDFETGSAITEIENMVLAGEFDERRINELLKIIGENADTIKATTKNLEGELLEMENDTDLFKTNLLREWLLNTNASSCRDNGETSSDEFDNPENEKFTPNLHPKTSISSIQRQSRSRTNSESKELKNIENNPPIKKFKITRTSPKPKLSDIEHRSPISDKKAKYNIESLKEDDRALDLETPSSSTPKPVSKPGRKHKISEKRSEKPKPSKVDSSSSEHNTSEEKFCSCKKSSYGDMIACDNSKCDIEWFHYGCVGLKQAPSQNENWYCPTCKPVFEKVV